MTPLFSVIVPTYDRPTYLLEAVESALRQTISDLEVIVIDDGSPHPLGDLRDARVRVIRHASNHGPAVARNSGLEAATGRYVTFLDDDDLYLPDRLEIALEGLERAPIVVCWSRWMGEPGRPGRTLDGDVSTVIAANLVPHLGTTTLERSVAKRFDEAFDAARMSTGGLLRRETVVSPRFRALRTSFVDTERHGTEMISTPEFAVRGCCSRSTPITSRRTRAWPRFDGSASASCSRRARTTTRP